MSEKTPNLKSMLATNLRRPEFIFAVFLFLAGAGALAYVARDSGLLQTQYSWGTALFFLVFGLFTILMGYARPRIRPYFF